MCVFGLTGVSTRLWRQSVCKRSRVCFSACQSCGVQRTGRVSAGSGAAAHSGSAWGAEPDTSQLSTPGEGLPPLLPPSFKSSHLQNTYLDHGAQIVHFHKLLDRSLSQRFFHSPKHRLLVFVSTELCFFISNLKALQTFHNLLFSFF